MTAQLGMPKSWALRAQGITHDSLRQRLLTTGEIEAYQQDEIRVLRDCLAAVAALIDPMSPDGMRILGMIGAALSRKRRA